jgi:hypothetical protein
MVTLSISLKDVQVLRRRHKCLIVYDSLSVKYFSSFTHAQASLITRLSKTVKLVNFQRNSGSGKKLGEKAAKALAEEVPKSSSPKPFTSPANP